MASSDPQVLDPLAAASSATSDETLLQGVLDGSHDAVAILYDRHASAVFGAALRVTTDRATAADVVQETFLALWNRAELFDASRGALVSWLVTIARNRAIDRVRFATRHERALSFSSFGEDHAAADDRPIADWLTMAGTLVAASDPERTPEAALTEHELHEDLQHAIAALPPREREVIRLAYGAGLSQTEIAERLDWPLGTVKTRTRRALHALRERLTHDEGLDRVLSEH
jgi:RNA polymerase sigma-70 factor (ECF subfamily)